jgi:hypothetical protein
MVMMYFSDSIIKQFKKFEHNSVKERTFWNHERKIYIQITMHLASFIFLRPNTGPCHISGKRAFGQASLVPAVTWAGTKGLATSA